MPTSNSFTRSRVTRSGGAEFATGALLFGVVLAYFALLAPYGIEVADEGHLVHQIYRTFLGQRPYLEFQTGYTPGVYYGNAFLFHLFGPNLLVVRLCLALVNSLTILCIYWLARRINLPRLVAAVPPLVYVALIPFYDGRFAPFNIPYPAWYVTLFWLAGLIALVKWWERRRLLPLFAAGLCAGLVFSLKPNSGLLDLAVPLYAVTLLQRLLRQPPPSSRPQRLLVRTERILRWLIPVVLAVGFSSLFTGGDHGGYRLVWLFALPLLILVGVHLMPRFSRQIARSVPPLTLWRDLVVLGLGFGATVVPWAAYYWVHLGTMEFLRNVLYIGTNYERFYLIDYPTIGAWGVALSVAIGAAVGIGAVVNRGWMSRRLVVIAAALAALVGLVWLLRHPPPMVEGFQSSVVMRVHAVTMTVLLFVEWAAIAAHVVQLVRGRAVPIPLHDVVAGHGRRRFEAQGGAFGGGVFLILLLSAVLMYMQLFPRSDYMHAVFASPGILILAGWLLGVAVRWWVPWRHPSAWATAGFAAAICLPVYAFVAIMVEPAVARIAYLEEAEWTGNHAALVRLDNPRAPLVMESSAGETLAGLGAVSQFLQSHTAPDDYVFTFPCLDFLAFLANRRDPTRHGYYYPGSPGHAVEAAVIDSLRQKQPPYIVALHDHALFFIGAPIYYFNLDAYVARHYALDERIGSFDVLRRVEPPLRRVVRAPEVTVPHVIVSKGEEDPEAQLANMVDLWRGELSMRSGAAVRSVDAALAKLRPPRIPALASAIEQMDEPAQRLMAELIRRSRSAEGGAALAMAYGQPTVSDVENELFIRIMAEVADVQAVPPLLRSYRNTDILHQLSIGGVLFTIASRTWVEGYWFAPSRPVGLDAVDRDLPMPMLVQWMDNPYQWVALRSFAIRMAGELRRRGTIPFLLRVLGDQNEMAQLRMDAAQSLVQLGFGPQVLPLINSLSKDDSLVPMVLTMHVAPEAPEAARKVVLKGMQSDDDDVRADAFWMAAGLDDPKLLPALEKGLKDPERQVQLASVWGLGNIGDSSSASLLRPIAREGNFELRSFARRALARLVARGAKQAGERGQD